MLSNNDGCVIARSNEAKALGIVMGDPWHLVKDRHAGSGIVVRSSNYTLYGDLSARVMRVLSDFTPELEVYSIDEAFLGLGGFEGRLEAHARQLRATVLQWTGIPVSVGIAPTKTLAKVANRTAKKDPASGGVCVLLTRAAQDEALGRLELTDLWGVANRMAPPKPARNSSPYPAKGSRWRAGRPDAPQAHHARCPSAAHNHPYSKKLRLIFDSKPTRYRIRRQPPGSLRNMAIYRSKSVVDASDDHPEISSNSLFDLAPPCIFNQLRLFPNEFQFVSKRPARGW